MKALNRVERQLAQRNVHGLCRLLRHRNALVRRRVAQALGELADPAAVSCLAQAVQQDADQYVRRWSIHSLGAIASPEAIDALTVAMLSQRVEVSQAATQALRHLDDPQAATALNLREMLFQHDWDALNQLDKTARRVLAAVLRSEQYASWPSARRRRLLELAIEQDATPPAEVSGELADMGLYVSEVHTLFDLVGGLFHRSPDVRAKAAKRLADTGLTWLTPLLYLRFRREMRISEERKVTAALARALDRLGDTRPIDRVQGQLHEGGQPATDAAYLLAEIGTSAAIETLFDYAANPPPPPAYRNVPLALSALQQVGPHTVDVLKPRLEDDSPDIRRLMVDVVRRSQHAARLDLLTSLAKDEDEAVQRAAVDALARENSAEAAEKLYELRDDVPTDQLAGALAAITDPAGPEILRKLTPSATTLTGTMRGDRGQPLKTAQVQLLAERLADDKKNWQWQAVSARVETDSQGQFSLALPGWEGDARLRLKLVIPAEERTAAPETHLADLPLKHGQVNHVEAQIDRFFDRLAVTVE